MIKVCNRCGGLIRHVDPQAELDGKPYHWFCKWKIEQKRDQDEKLSQTSQKDEKQ